VKVSDFVEGSLNHILHVGKYNTDEKIWELVKKHIDFVVGEIQVADILHAEEKYDYSDIEEESTLVVVTGQSYKVDHEGGPELDAECPCGSHE